MIGARLPTPVRLSDWPTDVTGGRGPCDTQPECGLTNVSVRKHATDIVMNSTTMQPITCPTTHPNI